MSTSRLISAEGPAKPATRCSPSSVSIISSGQPTAHEWLQFYRLLPWRQKVGIARFLLYVPLGYAIAGAWDPLRMFLNAVALLGLVMFQGALNDYWDYRLLGEENFLGTQMRTGRITPLQAKRLIALPLLLILPMPLSSPMLQVPPSAVGLLLAAVALIVAYAVPPVRLKARRPWGVLVSPVATTVFLFAESHLVLAPLTTAACQLAALLFLFQLYAELLYIAANGPMSGARCAPAVAFTLARWLPVVMGGVTLALALRRPVFWLGVGVAAVRFASIRRLRRAEDIARERAHTWRALMSAQEFLGYAAAGAFRLMAVCGGVLLWSLPSEGAPLHEPRKETIGQAIQRGLEFLSSRQQADGSWIIEVCSDASMTSCQGQTPIFGAASIVASLHGVEEPLAVAMRESAVRFLLQERIPQGLWRYLPTSSGAYQMFPPDLDDTSVSAYALFLAGMDAPTSFETLVGYRAADGLYPTWVAATGEGSDPAINARYTQDHQTVDCGVNANILAYLAQNGHAEAGVCGMLAQTVAEATESSCSVYYRSPEAVRYLISRAYVSGARCLGEAMSAVGQRVAAAQGADGSWGDELKTALAVSTLVNGGHGGAAADRGVQVLLEQQSQDGSWPRLVFYGEHSTPVVYGSQELTTALVLEALAKSRAPGRRLAVVR